MEIIEIAEEMSPSEIFTSITYDTESKEVGLQYGYVLLSLPVEDLESMVNLLATAAEQIENLS